MGDRHSTGMRRGRTRAGRLCAAIAGTMVVGIGGHEAEAAISPTALPQPFVGVGPLSNEFQSRGGATHPDTVTPGDTFSFDIAGFNSSTGNGVYITSNGGSGVLTSTFGITSTFASGVASGQTLTVTSGETVTPTLTTDTVTLSVPSTFLNAGSTFTGANGSGQSVNVFQFDIGQSNGGTNPINFLLPINPASNMTTGSITYGTTNTIFTLTPGTTFGAGGTTFAESEGVSVGTSDIGALGVHVFTVSVAYTTTPVPEPVGATAVAALVAATGLRRRKRVTSGRPDACG